MKKSSFFTIVAASVILFACYNDNKEEVYDNINNNQEQCDTSAVTYVDTVQAILTANCASAGCHSSTSRQSGLDLSQYTTAATIANDGRLLGRITGSSGALMPPGGPLPSCEILKLQKWAEDGAPEQ